MEPMQRRKKTPIQDVDKFIGSMVSRLIRSYEMDDFVLEGSGSDYRQDMMQTARLAVHAAQRRHPNKAKNPQYLKVVINNALFKFEQAGRTRRLNTSNLLDEPLSPHDDSHHIDNIVSLPEIEPYAAMEAQQDVQSLIEKADLSDSESLVVEMTYGFGRGEDLGECSVVRIAQLIGRSENYVRARLTAAMVKLQVHAES